MRGEVFSVVSLLAAVVVTSMIPRGAFGGYDVTGRAAVAGTVAALTGYLFATVSKRWGRSK